jgi:hypothetical protein
MLGAMRLLPALCLALALGPAAALAEEPVSPSEFREYAEGWTLHFEMDGEPFGTEKFEEGGQTLWRFKDGSCAPGVWRPHGAQVCFFYGGDSEVLCWRVLRDEQGIFVRLLGDTPDAGMELRITGRDHELPLCGEPGRGV